MATDRPSDPVRLRPHEAARHHSWRKTRNNNGDNNLSQLSVFNFISVLNFACSRTALIYMLSTQQQQHEPYIKYIQRKTNKSDTGTNTYICRKRAQPNWAEFNRCEASKVAGRHTFDLECQAELSKHVATANGASTAACKNFRRLKRKRGPIMCWHPSLIVGGYVDLVA